MDTTELQAYVSKLSSSVDQLMNSRFSENDINTVRSTLSVLLDRARRVDPDVELALLAAALYGMDEFLAAWTQPSDAPAPSVAMKAAPPKPRPVVDGVTFDGRYYHAGYDPIAGGGY